MAAADHLSQQFDEGSPEHSRFMDAHENATWVAQSRDWSAEKATGEAGKLQKRLDNWPKKGLGSGSMMKAQISGATQAYLDHASGKQ